MVAPPRIRDNDSIVGVLVAHGPARYQFEEENSASYYVKLRTLDEEGERVLWGTDLKRAIQESKSRVKIGQKVAARLTGRETLEPRVNAGDRSIPRYRNRWEIETPAFVAQRQATARKIIDDPVGERRKGTQHPEMTGLYLALRGAELISKQRYARPEDQAAFVQKIRELIAPTADRSDPTKESPVRER